MKKTIQFFLTETFSCGICTFIGSIIGNAFNQSGLFTGAIAGGVIGIILSSYLLLKMKIIVSSEILPIITWGVLFFLSASLFAVTNLNSPVIPLLSLLFVGIGGIIGKSYKFNKGQNKDFYHALAGYILILPTLYFVVGSIIKYNLGFSSSFTLLELLQNSSSMTQVFALTSPFIFFGGCLLCIFLNIPIKFKSRPKIYLTVSFLSTSLVNLFISLTSILLLIMIGLYLAVENF